MPISSQGATVSFSGTPLGRVTSIKAERSCSRLDITGFGSPDHIREVIPGDLDPITINVTVIGAPSSGVGAAGGLSVDFPGGGSYSYDNAFIERLEVDASVGEFIKATYTFVAST